MYVHKAMATKTINVLCALRSGQMIPGTNRFHMRTICFWLALWTSKLTNEIKRQIETLPLY